MSILPKGDRKGIIIKAKRNLYLSTYEIFS